MTGSTSARIPLTDLQQAYVLGQDSFALSGQAQGYLEIELPDPRWDALESALNRVIARQPMLRAAVASDTHFDVAESIPSYRIVHQRVESGDPQAARARAAEAAKRPFDRGTAPLIRVVAHEFGAGIGRIHFAYDFTIMDSTSVGIFLKEWARYYHQPLLVEPALHLPTGDGDGAHERKRRAWAYWERQLDELPGAPRFSLGVLPDRALTTMRTRDLSAEESAVIRDYASAHRSTISAVLLTAYADALRLWTEDHRFLLTLTAFDRPAGAEDLIGDFSTTVLIDITLDAPGFRERLADVQDKLWEGLQHRAVSGVEVGRELQRRRRTAEPIAPVVFTSLLGAGTGTEPLGRVVSYDSHTPQALCDLVVSEPEGGLRLTLYAQDDPAFRFVAEGLWCDLLAWVATIAAATPGESPGSPPPSAACAVHPPSPPAVGRFSSLTEIAATLPGADDTAALISSRGMGLSRAGVRERVVRAAAGLSGHGAGPGATVAIAVARDVDQYLLALAVARTGAAYVPIDVALPVLRQRRILDHAQPDLLVLDPEATELIAAESVVQVSPGELFAVDDRGARRTRQPRPADLAYVLYTSGSTGEPKGVAMSGAAAVNTLNDITDRFGIGPDDRIISTAQLGFDLSVFDLFGTAMVGASVVVADAGLEREPEVLLRLIRETRATVWNSVPAVFEIAVQHLEDMRERLPPDLRLVMLSGDVIAPALPGRCWAVTDPLQQPPVIVALGGATEAGIWSNYHVVERAHPPAVRVPYGRALRGQVLDVVDFARRPRPPGIVGEIAIGGVSLADGYWRDAELTEQRFVRGTTAQDRRYLTGDLGYVRADGVVEILGRVDRQIKLGGQRIELGDVEAAIGQVLGVRGAIVAVTGSAGRASLRAYVAGPVTADRIAEFVRTRLPSHMIPKSWVVLPAFPLTNNGKIDHAALADLADVPAAPPSSEASSATESWLARLWCDVLDVEAVGPVENFFELGGDSLLATRLRGRLAREFGVHISVRELFASVDLRDMARRIERTLPAPAGSDSRVEAVRLSVLDVLRRQSGASIEEIREAGNLFDVGILTSHSVASAAVELEASHSVELLSDFRVSQWTNFDSIVNLMLTKVARS